MVAKQQEQEQGDDIDYELMGQQMKKAGIVTKDTLDKALGEALEQIRQERAKEQTQMTEGANNQENEMLMHLQNGGCSDPNCQITKEIKKLSNDVFSKGMYIGVKTGQYGASKGVYVE